MDVDLVVRAQQGDQRAFEMLAADAYTRLFRLAHGILRDGAKADDATQQALVSIWRSLPRLRDPARFEGWCCRLLVNACHDQVRRAPRWTSAATLPRSQEPLAYDAISPVAERDALEHALRRVSFDQRTVLAMRFLFDMTPDEIAETLTIPRKTVYSRLKRGVESMRAAMEAEIRPVMSGAASGEAVR